MIRRVDSTYTFPGRDVRELLCEFLKRRGLPSPGYVGDTDTVKWKHETDGTVTVTWRDVADVEVPGAEN